MAHKKFGGWMFNRKIFAQVKIANELWYDATKPNYKSVHLFRLGWHESEEFPSAKLLSLIVLWVSIQVGLTLGGKNN